MNQKKVERLIHDLLVEMGEDPRRQGLLRTPERVAKSFEFLTSGYRSNLKRIINRAVFDAECKDMIIVRDIEIYSLCEHHMLPFYGRCHIGYIPRKKVIGISKIARIVDYFGRRLQMQERLTSQIAEEVLSAIEALGVGVVMECRHLCMMMRGVEKQNSVMTTSSVLGLFRESAATRNEFLALIGHRNIQS